MCVLRRNGRRRKKMPEKMALRPLKPGEFRVDPKDPTRKNTELTASFGVGGQEILVPTLWMDAAGKIRELSGRQALEAALEFEKRTGQRFPRFSTPEEATEFSRARSARGGVFGGSLHK
jgi:hypothetical protein